MVKGLIRSNDIFEIGGFLNHWFDRRMSRNQNVLIGVTGATGSSKTYDCLSCAEAWYKFRFNSAYPIENVCFSIGSLAKRIAALNKEGKLRKGELLILEEAGANFGNLDFQNKLSKMFNYILQSFRSLNLILLMNLPVLTMLNKGARQLIHAHFVTAGIDYELQIAKVKPYFHQLNQNTGKSYWKYPRIKVNGRTTVLRRLKFIKPTPELLEQYEATKKNFVVDLTNDLIIAVDKDEREKLMDIAKTRKILTDRENDALDLVLKGMYDKKEMANVMGIKVRCLNAFIQSAIKKGYDVEKLLEKNRLLGAKSSEVMLIAPKGS